MRALQQFGALSYSSMKEFEESPAAFLRYKNGTRKPYAKTKAFEFGTMFELYLWHKDKFNASYICAGERPEKNKAFATKANKDWKKKQIEAGFKIYSTEDFEDIKRMEDSIYSDKIVREHLEQLTAFDAKFEIEDLFGFKFHGIKDAEGETICIDLKTCAKAKPHKFHYDFRYKFAYGKQAAIYSQHKGQKMFYLAADRLGGVSLHEVSQETINENLRKLEEHCTRLKECIFKNDFPNYGFWVDGGVFEI